MNQCINQAGRWLNNHPKLRQWAWFVALWCGGLAAVITASYLIKFMMGV